jgi:hypothetical protein
MLKQKSEGRDPSVELRPPLPEQRGGLTAVIEPTSPRRRRWRLRVEILALVLLISSAAGIGWSWWRHLQGQLPPGTAYGNGRLEADAIDIDAKFAGRIAGKIERVGRYDDRGFHAPFRDAISEEVKNLRRVSQSLIRSAENSASCRKKICPVTRETFICL